MKYYLIPAIMLAASPLSATDLSDSIAAYATEQMEHVASNPVIIAAIQSQNKRTQNLSTDEIAALDRVWRLEAYADSQPMVSAVLSNEVSAFLRELSASSEGRISEVFVMDARGLNVGLSNVTSDYWQGDEAKFTETVPHGPGAMHVSEISQDDSAQTLQAQVSLSITDPETGQSIGAVTFGIEAFSFF